MSRILAALHFQQHIGMTSTTFPAAKLLGAQRMGQAIQAMTGSANISRLASENNVSRKFVYQQKNLALEAINDAFAPTAADDEVLFYLPVTKAWLRQVVLALTLICHSSYRGVVQFIRDILGVAMSVGSVHNLHQLAAQRAAAINSTQDLSQIRVGLHDEIFHCNEPVLVGKPLSGTTSPAMAMCFTYCSSARAWPMYWPVWLRVLLLAARRWR